MQQSWRRNMTVQRLPGTLCHSGKRLPASGVWDSCKMVALQRVCDARLAAPGLSLRKETQGKQTEDCGLWLASSPCSQQLASVPLPHAVTRANRLLGTRCGRLACVAPAAPDEAAGLFGGRASLCGFFPLSQEHENLRGCSSQSAPTHHNRK